MTTESKPSLDRSKIYKDHWPPYLHSLLVNDVGYGFVNGTVWGFFYHFAKAMRSGLPLKHYPSHLLTKVPRVSGFCALLCGTYDATRLAVYHLRNCEDYLVDNIAVMAATAGLFFSPRGFGPASLAALGFGANVAMKASLNLVLKNMEENPAHLNIIEMIEENPRDWRYCVCEGRNPCYRAYCQERSQLAYLCKSSN